MRAAERGTRAGGSCTCPRGTWSVARVAPAEPAAPSAAAGERAMSGREHSMIPVVRGGVGGHRDFPLPGEGWKREKNGWGASGGHMGCSCVKEDRDLNRGGDDPQRREKQQGIRPAPRHRPDPELRRLPTLLPRRSRHGQHPAACPPLLTTKQSRHPSQPPRPAPERHPPAGKKQRTATPPKASAVKQKMSVFPPNEERPSVPYPRRKIRQGLRGFLRRKIRAKSTCQLESTSRVWRDPIQGTEVPFRIQWPEKMPEVTSSIWSSSVGVPK